MAANLDLRWGDGDTLTILGSDFRPRERVALTMAIRSGGSTVRTGPGTLIQSSQSSNQSTTITIAADADGRLRFGSTIVASPEAEITVTATGSEGSRAEGHTSPSRAR